MSAALRPGDVDDNADEIRAAREEAEAEASAAASARHVARAALVFNGRYTVTSPTGEHRTFEVRTLADDSTFAPGKRVVSLLVGPNNTGDYQAFGFIDDRGVAVWKSKRGEPGAPSFFDRVAPLFFSLAAHGERSPWYARGFRVLAEATCLRCNRALTTPESILSGIGPTCAGR